MAIYLFIYLSIYFHNIYLLLTEFKVGTVSYGPSVFPLINGPSMKRLGHKSTGKHSVHNLHTDRENEVSKIFIISLRLIGRAGKETFTCLAGHTVKNGPQN